MEEKNSMKNVSNVKVSSLPSLEGGNYGCVELNSTFNICSNSILMSIFLNSTSNYNFDIILITIFIVLYVNIIFMLLIFGCENYPTSIDEIDYNPLTQPKPIKIKKLYSIFIINLK